MFRPTRQSYGVPNDNGATLVFLFLAVKQSRQKPTRRPDRNTSRTEWFPGLRLQDSQGAERGRSRGSARFICQCDGFTDPPSTTMNTKHLPPGLQSVFSSQSLWPQVRSGRLNQKLYLTLHLPWFTSKTLRYLTPQIMKIPSSFYMETEPKWWGGGLRCRWWTSEGRWDQEETLRLFPSNFIIFSWSRLSQRC